MFSDANSEYEKGALRALVHPFHESTVGFVTGWTRYGSARGSLLPIPSDSIRRIELITKELESRLGSCIGADGAIFAIRKELYLPLKDYDINDFVIPLSINQQGYRGVLQRDAICFEKDAGGAKGEFHRQVRITNRTIRAIMNYRQLLNPFRFGLLSFELFSHKVCKFLVPLFMVAAARIEPDSGGARKVLPMVLIAQGIFYAAAAAACVCTEGKHLVSDRRSGENLRGRERGHRAGVGQVLPGRDLYHVVSDKTIVPLAGPPAMSFRLFLLCSFVLLGRPQDILPFLQPLRPALVLTVLAMVATVFGARRTRVLGCALDVRIEALFALFSHHDSRHPICVSQGSCL